MVLVQNPAAPVPVLLYVMVVEVFLPSRCSLLLLLPAVLLYFFVVLLVPLCTTVHEAECCPIVVGLTFDNFLHACT